MVASGYSSRRRPRRRCCTPSPSCTRRTRSARRRPRRSVPRRSRRRARSRSSCVPASCSTSPPCGSTRWSHCPTLTLTLPPDPTLTLTLTLTVVPRGGGSVRRRLRQWLERRHRRRLYLHSCCLLVATCYLLAAYYFATCYFLLTTCYTEGDIAQQLFALPRPRRAPASASPDATATADADAATGACLGASTEAAALIARLSAAAAGDAAALVRSEHGMCMACA